MSGCLSLGEARPMPTACVPVACSTGPGAASLDNAFNWNLTSTTWGITAVAAGFIAGAMNLAYRQMHIHPEHTIGGAQTA